MRIALRCLASLVLLAIAAGAQSPSDADHDGLPDAVEAQLLEQFRPAFLVSRHDCDQLPGELAAGEAAPRVIARNGTIYGQATPHAADTVELRYFHIWSRDCGRRGHAGDVEHVAALLRQAPDGSWSARYWYASAHHGTRCDRCMAARADTVQALDHGPQVYISAGKHASYLSQALCNGGCGGDTCREMQALPTLPIVNLGEVGAPLHGATWAAASPQVPMASDFDAALIAQLDASPSQGPFRVSAQTKGMQRTISVSNTTLGGLQTAEEHTGNALDTAHQKTGSALQRSYRAVKDWLRGGKK